MLTDITTAVDLSAGFTLTSSDDEWDIKEWAELPIFSGRGKWVSYTIYPNDTPARRQRREMYQRRYARGKT